MNSPKILELSGIGQPELLKSLGIDLRHGLPGVGENLTDHLQSRITYETNQKVTINDILNSRIRGAMAMARYLVKSDGLMAISSATVHAIMRSDPELTHPDIKLQIMLVSGKDRYARGKKIGTDPFSGFNIGVFPIYPKSRGSTHARSTDPAELHHSCKLPHGGGGPGDDLARAKARPQRRIAIRHQTLYRPRSPTRPRSNG